MTMTYARHLALAVAMLAVTSPSLARDKKPVDPNKKICRSEVPTGSRMTKSICHTPSEWAQIDAANAASTQSIHDQAFRSSAQQ